MTLTPPELPEFDAADIPLPPLAGTDDPDGWVFTSDGRIIIPADDDRGGAT